MVARRILAVVLLLFAVVALGAAIWKHTQSSSAGQAGQDGEPGPGQDKTVVYYLHGTFRCPNCMAVEATSRELVQSEFADEVKAGRLEWRAEDFLEKPRLARLYEVTGPMVVVARFEDGKLAKADRLTGALELAGEPDRLKDYLRSGIIAGVPERNMQMALWAALAAAFGFGLLTAISPCPLATNVAAISFLGRNASQPRKVLLSGLAYTVGRTVVYVVLGVLIIWLLRQPWAGGGKGGGASVSQFLQTYGGIILGPTLVIAGLFLLGLLRSSRSLNLAGQGLQQKAARGGVAWAFVLGVLFALSFCPISAMIFFGSMITLSTANQSLVLLPSAFGIATALPVIVFAFLIAFAGRYVGNAFNRMTQIDRWLRFGTGAIFIAAGVFYSLAHLGVVSGGFSLWR